MNLKIRDFVFVGIILILVVSLFKSCNQEPIIKTEYVKGETVYDTIYKLKPISVEIPQEPEYIYRTKEIVKRDTIVKVKEIDSAAIVKDWTKNRLYEKTLFDNDTIGELNIKASVQYNKLQNLSYDFTPIHKETKIIKSKTLSPFLGVQVSTMGYYGVTGGVFVDNWGFSLGYMKGNKKEGAEVGIYYRF